ncbi:MAG: hypothetical protein ACPHK8_05775 [Thermoplasmatota archaeon]
MVQCAALKADATKCNNHAREGSKYCASHKGYRPKGTAKAKLDNLKKARAMKQVRARAKKTAGGTGAIRNRPAAIKVMGAKAQCAAKTQAGKPCKNLPRPGSKYCVAHKGYRA